MAEESWIYIQQLPHDMVRYMTDLQSGPSITSYKEFLKLMSRFYILDQHEFMLNFNRLFLIHLDLITGEWKIEALEHGMTRKEVFDKFAEVTYMNEQKEVPKAKDQLTRSKNFINNVSKWNDKSSPFYRK